MWAAYCLPVATMTQEEETKKYATFKRDEPFKLGSGAASALTSGDDLQVTLLQVGQPVKTHKREGIYGILWVT